MVRTVLSLLFWIVFVGGLAFYMQHRAANVPASNPVVAVARAEGHFTLEITPTFAVEPDPFALVVDDATAPPALLVRLGAQEILRVTDRLEAGASLRLEPVTGLAAGINEIYLEASPPVDEIAKSYAVRMRLLRGGLMLADKTFWSSSGEKVSDILRFDLKDTDESANTNGKSHAEHP